MFYVSHFEKWPGCILSRSIHLHFCNALMNSEWCVKYHLELNFRRKIGDTYYFVAQKGQGHSSTLVRFFPQIYNEFLWNDLNCTVLWYKVQHWMCRVATSNGSLPIAFIRPEVTLWHCSSTFEIISVELYHCRTIMSPPPLFSSSLKPHGKFQLNWDRNILW